MDRIIQISVAVSVDFKRHPIVGFRRRVDVWINHILQPCGFDLTTGLVSGLHYHQQGAL